MVVALLLALALVPVLLLVLAELELATTVKTAKLLSAESK